MTKAQFKNLVKKGIILLDGSSGVELQKRGMPAGVCPEKWILENPSYLYDLQQEYIKAGSQIIYTFTFGANPYKLKEFNLEKKVYSINKKLALLTKKVAGKNILVAGDIAPTGHFPEPFGDIDFNEHIEQYKKQVKGLLAGGVDLFVVETMMDIQETRAAIFAIKELCDLPIMVSLTFDESKRTLTGTSPESAVISLQYLGIDAIGTNCSTGPDKMIDVIKAMAKYANLPLIAKPNAGMPVLKDGKTFFSMTAYEFASYTKKLIKAGAVIVGGCCGTSPEFIKLMKKEIKKLDIDKLLLKENKKMLLSNGKSFIDLSNKNQFTIIGERINPTGKTKLQESLKSKNFIEIRNLAVEQIEKGAKILDVNVGMPGINEKHLMKDIVNYLCKYLDVILCIDSSSPEVIKTALKIYPGRALINSISCEKKKLKDLLPIAKYFGAMFILLPVDDKGVPQTSIDRIKKLKKPLKIIAKQNFKSDDFIIDGLVMTVSSNQNAANETLKFIKWIKSKGFKSIIGLSNVSFGLPERNIINSTFLHLSKKAGLNFAIANPSANLKIVNKDAIKLLTGKDKNCRNWIQKYSSIKKSDKKEIKKEKSIYDTIIKGEKEEIPELIKQELERGKKPEEIVDNILIPAINQVGDLYDKKIYFLPQLIASADAMKTAFNILEPLLLKKTEDKKEIKIILATVKGDIHDIGKNIVALMLKNYGYKIHDLGKDIASEYIIKKAKELNADIIGLSALMTTTMPEMKKVIDMAKKQNINCKFMIGGAVVTQAYADEIGAKYAKDAYDAVKLVKSILKT